MADNAAKTIVLTGASSGIGKATAKLFFDKGWNVVATMRNPAAETDLRETDMLKLVALDVQNPASPPAAVAAALDAFGKIDVWLNNAGYGATGPVEAIMTIPSYGVYNASKFAVEGLSEGLWYELGTFGVKVKLIEPGAIKTDFGGRSMDAWDVSALPDYAPFVAKVKAARAEFVKKSSTPELVAGVIYEAATDPSDTLRYLAGPDAKRFWPVRRWAGYKFQMKMVKRAFKL
jgi:NAD(P)-dependent dehydrogenase (short-subunit alcohol dehydrogenase family)